MSKAVTQTEFVAWLRTTEGPRQIDSDPLTDPLDVGGGKLWRTWCHVKGRCSGLSFHKSVEAAERAAMKYARWLNEFEKTEGEHDE
jgi:hypothetical protein